MGPQVVLVTGAVGLMGQALLRQLARDEPSWTVIATDARPTPLQGPQQKSAQKSVDDEGWEALTGC